MRMVVEEETRLPSNLMTFLLTCLILSLSISLSNGFGNNLDEIANNLKEAVDDLRSHMPNYRDYVDDHVYLSTKITFNPKGMAGLYNLTTQFMNAILPQDVLMKDLILWQESNNYSYPKLNDNVTIVEVLKYYWPLLLVILIITLITILVPVVGLFFCCCRCCGNCGARTKPCDKRRDLCKKVFQGALLIALGTALLFCVVCAFASNQQIQDGIEDFPDTTRSAYKDSLTYLDSTKDGVKELLSYNYIQFADVFKRTIHMSGEHVMQQLNIWSNATAMMHLYNFVKAMPKIADQLEKLKRYTNNMRAMASQLNDATRKIKRDLLTILKNCTLDQCKSIQKQISSLQTNIDFNRLPDVTPAIDVLDRLDFKLLKTAAEEGKSKLDNIEKQIASSLNVTLKQASGKVERAGKMIEDNLNNITQVLTDVQTQMKVADSALDESYSFLKRYSPYRYYGSLSICCVLLIITICIVLGLICGICGKRPDGYSDNCCNKGAGSQFLMCAVILMFLFSLVIGLVALGSLILGMASNRAICYPLRNPQNSTVLDLIDDDVRRHSRLGNIDVPLSRILDSCYKNESIYRVFNLANKFDVDEITSKFDVESILATINSRLDKIVDPHFTILNNTNLNILRSLSTFDLGINFDHFQDELRQNFTNMSLKELSSVLQDLVDRMEDRKPDFDNVQSELKLNILHVNMYDEKILAPMRLEAKEVMIIAHHLDSSLKMNATSFTEAIDNLINEIEDAQQKLREDGSKMLINAATSFGDIVKDQVQSYKERVVHVTKFKLGRCGPLNVAMNSTLTSVCEKILLPWNGFWVSLFASLLLFVPTIIVSIKLSSLYQRYKQYGQYVETRGGSKPRGRKKKKTGKRLEERHPIGEVVTREFAAGSQPPDSRYADMAPKHWDEFPNGGPPQYQRAPTEYERPPPYYFPGSGEQ